MKIARLIPLYMAGENDLFTNYRPSLLGEPINVSIEVILTRVCSTTFLGVQMEEGLNWKEHIELLTSKLIKVSGIISEENVC